MSFIRMKPDTSGVFVRRRCSPFSTSFNDGVKIANSYLYTRFGHGKLNFVQRENNLEIKTLALAIWRALDVSN